MLGALSLFVVSGGWYGTFTYWPYWVNPDGAIDHTITGYERTLSLESANAVDWLNLATLYALAGRDTDAIRAADQAVHYAPDAPIFAINRGLILEQFGHGADARAAYELALQQAPDLADQPIWRQSALRQSAAAAHPAPATATQTLFADLAAGQIDAARQSVATEKALYNLRAQPYIDSALLTIRTHGDLSSAERDLNAAQMIFDPFADSWAWLHYALGELAGVRGNRARQAQEDALAHHDPNQDARGAIFSSGGDLSIATYFAVPPSRDLLPGVWYPGPPGDVLPFLMPPP